MFLLIQGGPQTDTVTNMIGGCAILLVVIVLLVVGTAILTR